MGTLPAKGIGFCRLHDVFASIIALSVPVNSVSTATYGRLVHKYMSKLATWTGTQLDGRHSFTNCCGDCAFTSTLAPILPLFSVEVVATKSSDWAGGQHPSESSISKQATVSGLEVLPITSTQDKKRNSIRGPGRDRFRAHLRLH